MKARLSLFISVLSFVPCALVAQSTAFTYQGRLISAGAPANGLYEMSFSLYDALTNGNPIGTPVTVAPVPVSNGLFTATLDFGANAFIGADRWLEVSVTVFGSDQPVVLLVPRQPMTATPYALHAANAAGLMSFANAPLDIKVNGQRALRLEIATSGLGVAPNVIGGSSANIVTGGAIGATIAGGGASIYDGAPVPNNVSADFGSVGGGKSNVSSGFAATVAGGSGNQSTDGFATVGGGEGNTSSAQSATVAGGAQNTSSGQAATVGGGALNVNTGEWATIAGGLGNGIASNAHRAFIGGGSDNQIATGAFQSTVSGGGENEIQDGAFYSTIGGGIENIIRPSAISSTVAGGFHNQIQTNGTNGTIGGGNFNVIVSGSYATVGGGQQNTSGGDHATISGGHGNTNGAPTGVIGGGAWNTVQALAGVIGGGLANTAGGDAATVAGGSGNRASGYVSTIAGGTINSSDGFYGAVGGGQANSTDNIAATVAGGEENSARASYCAIGGGKGNLASSYASVIAGGGGLMGDDMPVGNIAAASWATVGGGFANRADGERGTISGGYSNTVHGLGSIVPGGGNNEASGNLSFAAGFKAKALHDGSFVWSDSAEADFTSDATNEFAVRATGGVRFVSAIETNGSNTAGVILAAGSGTWSTLSDRDAKENFTPANARELLEKVAALPLASWNYKAQNKSIRHLGPMAQDFHGAFGLGENDRTITTVDADGVALAAIQGLNVKLEEELKAKDSRIADLERRLAEIERRFGRTAPK